MENFDIKNLLPNFILKDRNGFALAKATEKGLFIMENMLRKGFETHSDIDKMPEWRLDEIAQENDLIYDYFASVNQKRYWIKNMEDIEAKIGTKQAIIDYLSAYFSDVQVIEASEYGGENFHFKIVLNGTWTKAKEDIIKRVIREVKNVRSVLDSISIANIGVIEIEGEKAYYRYFFPKTGDDLLCGTVIDNYIF